MFDFLRSEESQFFSFCTNATSSPNPFSWEEEGRKGAMKNLGGIK